MRRTPSGAFLAALALPGIEKVARLYGTPPFTPGEHSWSDRYKGTPFYKQALEIEREEVLLEAEQAQQRVHDEQRYAEESQLRAEQAQLDADLAQWRYEQMGIGVSQAQQMAQAKEKVAYLSVAKSCAGPGMTDWSDYYKGTPFYDRALDLERRSADLDAKRAADDAAEPRRNFYAERRLKKAQLEAAYVKWKIQQAGAQEAPRMQAPPVEVKVQ